MVKVCHFRRFLPIYRALLHRICPVDLIPVVYISIRAYLRAFPAGLPLSYQDLWNRARWNLIVDYSTGEDPSVTGCSESSSSWSPHPFLKVAPLVALSWASYLLSIAQVYQCIPCGVLEISTPMLYSSVSFALLYRAFRLTCSSRMATAFQKTLAQWWYFDSQCLTGHPSSPPSSVWFVPS